jgi:Xaa-Pro aminopeptidase
MNSNFNSRFFSGNRHRLRQVFAGTAPIVITANGLLQRGGDSSYPFAQDANFWYLTGIDEPDIVLVMDRDQEYLIVPARTASREAFDGAISESALSQRSGVKEVYSDAEGWEKLADRLKKVRHVATVAKNPDYIETYGLYSNPARARLARRLLALNSDLEFVDLVVQMARLRMIKQAPEIKALQAAIDITSETLKDALRPAKLSTYEYEYQLEARLTYGYRYRGANGHAFEPIVAGGPRACTLHNVANEGRLKPNELVLVDTGAEVEHYAADITRVRAITEPTRRQQAVHAAVLEVQKFALGMFKPGMRLQEYEEQVGHFMGEKLQELNLIKEDSHEAIRHYYPHATSHFLGLNVHDVGDYDHPLEPGMVLTIEPGIYIPEEGIGVRIEDNVLITPEGHQILSDNLSRDLV